MFIIARPASIDSPQDGQQISFSGEERSSWAADSGYSNDDKVELVMTSDFIITVTEWEWCMCGGELVCIPQFDWFLYHFIVPSPHWADNWAAVWRDKEWCWTLIVEQFYTFTIQIQVDYCPPISLSLYRPSSKLILNVILSKLGTQASR